MYTLFFSWIMVLFVLKVDCVRTDDDFKMSKMSSKKRLFLHLLSLVLVIRESSYNSFF
jgi:hypothetical protein